MLGFYASVTVGLAPAIWGWTIKGSYWGRVGRVLSSVAVFLGLYGSVSGGARAVCAEPLLAAAVAVFGGIAFVVVTILDLARSMQ